MKARYFLLITLLLNSVTCWAKEQYVNAAPDLEGRLRITMTDGRTVILEKAEDKDLGHEQVSFQDVAVSVDRRSVAWIEYFTNCCTSYPIPRRLGLYNDGRRRVLWDAGPIAAWIFVDKGSRIALVSEPLHGPMHQLYVLLKTSTAEHVADYVQLDGGRPAVRPRWVETLDHNR